MVGASGKSITELSIMETGHRRLKQSIETKNLLTEPRISRSGKIIGKLKGYLKSFDKCESYTPPSIRVYKDLGLLEKSG